MTTKTEALAAEQLVQVLQREAHSSSEVATADIDGTARALVEAIDRLAALAQPVAPAEGMAPYEAVESSIVARYRVERKSSGFWPYCVKAGDGTMELFIGHRTQCERVASALKTACLDGAFMASGATPTAAKAAPPEPVAHICILPTKDAGPTKFFTAPSDPRGFPVYTHPAPQGAPAFVWTDQSNQELRDALDGYTFGTAFFAAAPQPGGQLSGVSGSFNAAHPVPQGACDECGKSSAAGWALYCVKCAEQALCGGDHAEAIRAPQPVAPEKFVPAGTCTCAGPDGPCEGCIANREAYEEWQSERAAATTGAEGESPQAAAIAELHRCWEHYRWSKETADAIEAVLATPPALAAEVPAGWKLVPDSATHRMLNAATAARKKGRSSSGEIYRVMLAASPTHPAAEIERPEGEA